MPAARHHPTADSAPVLRPLPALALAALSGVLGALAYPGRLSLWPLALLAGCPLYVAVAGQRLLRRIGHGWLAGMVTVALSAHWLPAAYQRITGASGAASAGLQALFCAWHGLDLALLVALAAALRAARLPRSLSWALAHVAAELSLPRLLPYSYASTLHGAPWALQSLAWLGPVSVVFLLAGMHAALAECWLQRKQPARARRELSCWALAWAAQLGLGALERHSLAEQRGPSLTVGVVQANTQPFSKRDLPDESLQAHLQASAALLARERPDVLVWSETAIATPLPAEQLGGAILRRLRGGLGVPLVLGAVVREHTPAGERQLNSILSVASDGFLCADCRYDKLHLLPLVEDTARAGARAFAPGTHPRLLPVAGSLAAPLVCFEVTSARAVRALMREGDASWLVNLANDGWFGDSSEPAFHLAQAQLRAIEQRRYLVRATTTGISAVIAPDGQLIARAERGPAAFSARITLRHGATPYQRLGDAPWWAALLASGLFALAGRWRARPAAAERS